MKHLRMFGQDKSVCGAKGQLTEDWKQAKHCGLCVRTDAFKIAKQESPILYKNLRQAITDKVDIKLRVTPGQSKIVQEIAFSMGIQWFPGYKQYLSEQEPYLYITPGVISYSNNHKRFNSSGLSEFSLEEDSFVEEEILSACGKTLEEFLEAFTENSSIVLNSFSASGGGGSLGIMGKDRLLRYIKHYGLSNLILAEQDDNEYRFENGTKFKEKLVKPPIGLTPRHIHIEQRIEAIKEAFNRYVLDEKKIPYEWVSEYLELINKTKGSI